MNYANESERRSNLTGLTTRCLQKCRSIIINFFLPYTSFSPIQNEEGAWKYMDREELAFDIMTKCCYF